MKNELLFNMNDISYYQNLKNFQNEEQEKTFYLELARKGMILTDESIKILFNLSDDEFNNILIKQAIKMGEVWAGNLSGEKIINAAENGEKWAILKLHEMNNGKQKQETTSREVVYKNANNIIDLDELKKQSDFNL